MTGSAIGARIAALRLDGAGIPQGKGDGPMGMLVLTREAPSANRDPRLGEICIGDDVVVRVVQVEGNRVRLGIEAPAGLRVDRREVRDRILRAAAAEKGGGGGD